MSKLEKEIEKNLVKMVKANGGRCEKVICQGCSGFPDRTILMPGGVVMFVETKRPKGGRYSALQDKWRDWLNDMGHMYFRVKDTEDIKWLELMIKGAML